MGSPTVRIAEVSRRVRTATSSSTYSTVLTLPVTTKSAYTEALRDLGFQDGEVFVKFDNLPGSLEAKARIEPENCHISNHYHAPSEVNAEFLHLVRIHEVLGEETAKPIAVLGETAGPLGYAMRFMKGSSLYNLFLVKGEEIMESGAFRVIAESLRAVAAKLHRMHLYHGDINVRNILVQDDFRVKLIDPMPGVIRKNVSTSCGTDYFIEFDTKKMHDVSEFMERVNSYTPSGRHQVFECIRSRESLRNL